jgi:lysophospholipase L1-like esterase
MRRPLSALSALLVLLLVASGATPAPTSAASYPRTMAATGDSITRAFNTGWLPFTDNPAASWATGTDSRVNSHYLRLLGVTPSGKLTAYNDARSGARMQDLNGQVQRAVSQGAEYVTVLMGANDVCTSSEGSMTSVTNFRTQFTAAMNTLAAGAPRARVYVVSIPDVHHLWEILHTNYWARLTWDVFDICQSMLANAGSTDPADAARRERVRQRNIEFNDVLAQVCAQYAQCRFDGYAAFNTQFVTADVSTRDYFHPSIAGQAKGAAVSWQAGYWGG